MHAAISPRLTILLFACMCFAHLAFAQKERRLHISPGLQFAAERDFGYSPLMFTGVQGYVSAAYGVENPVKSDMLELSFLAGNLSNSFSTKSKATSASFNTYTFYHKEKDPTRGFHWGWANNNVFHIRDNDAIVNFNNRFDYYTSFGPAVRYRKPFNLWGQQLTFQALSHLQLIGFIMQSSYVSQGPKGYEREYKEGADVFFKSIDLFIPGRAWSYSLWPSLQYELNSGTRLCLNYRYEYSCLRGAHMVRKSHGKWFFSIIAGL
jgi:hypothetical protein